MELDPKALDLARKALYETCGIDVPLPSDGDLDDREREIYEGFCAAIRAYLTASRSGETGWLDMDSAPKDGTYILLRNEWGTWIGYYVPRYQSGFVPDNPWQSLMLNHRHMPGAQSLVPTGWQPLPTQEPKP